MSGQESNSATAQQLLSWSSVHGFVSAQGSVVWLAAHVCDRDDAARSLVGDFARQVPRTFRDLVRGLVGASAALFGVVAVTCFLTDPSNECDMTRLAAPDLGPLPAAMGLLAKREVSRGMQIAIQAVAVVPA